MQERWEEGIGGYSAFSEEVADLEVKATDLTIKLWGRGLLWRSGCRRGLQSLTNVDAFSVKVTFSS